VQPEEGNLLPDSLNRQALKKRAIEAFKTGLAAVLCLWLGKLLGLSNSYWAAISAIVVMGSDTSVTFISCRDRLIGTAIGASLGWAAAYYWHGHFLLYGASVMVAVFACGLLQFEKAGRLAAVALTIIVLIYSGKDPGRAALARFCEVSLGIVVALAVTMLVFPVRQVNEALHDQQ